MSRWPPTVFHDGFSFDGTIAFVSADLIALPLVVL